MVMRIARLIVAGTFCWLAAHGSLRAEVRPHPLFSEGAVVQRGMPVPVWGWADEAERVTVSFQGQEVSTTAQGGRWRVELAPLETGGPAEMTIRGTNELRIKNVLVGEVWIASGQSNMAMTVANSDRAEEEIAAAANPQIRLLTVGRAAADEPQSTVAVSWMECGPATVGRFSAVGYFFARDLQEALGVPLGVINTSYGGTPAEAWTSREALLGQAELGGILESYTLAVEKWPEAQKRYEEALAQWRQQVQQARQQGKQPPRQPRPPAGPENPRRPSALYNAMIAPLVPYAHRGVIWYQGEANAARAYEYRTLFPAMIQDWRKAWGQGNTPFLFVQLAPYRARVSQPGESDWAELREAQLLTTRSVARTAMAVITDVGDEDDIHPKKKQPVGHRLSLAALALAYGRDIEYSGPSYKSLEVRGDKAVLRFDHLGGGLVAKDGPLRGFAVCGGDRKFVNAHAEIDGDTVVVRSAEVSQPVAVRYGWADYPLGNLWNKAGLPASAFRTDAFPGLTQPRP